MKDLAASEPRELVLASVVTPLPSVDAPKDGESISIPVTILPAPVDGMVTARDGRHWRVPDIRSLVTDLNAQPIDVRVDFDHQTEEKSKTYRQNSEAQGWVSGYKVSASGGISATMELLSEAATKVSKRLYRYLSPGLVLENKTSRRVIGLSSVGLVNNPALTLAPITLSEETDAGDTMTKEELAALTAREEKVTADEKALRTELLSTAEVVVDAAVDAGVILPAQRDYHLATITANKDGIVKGLEAFKSFLSTAEGDPTPNRLTQRVGPKGAASRKGQAAAGSVVVPPGVGVDESRLELLAAVRAHAVQHKIPFAQALTEYAAMNGGADF